MKREIENLLDTEVEGVAEEDRWMLEIDQESLLSYSVEDKQFWINTVTAAMKAAEYALEQLDRTTSKGTKVLAKQENLMREIENLLDTGVEGVAEEDRWMLEIDQESLLSYSVEDKQFWINAVTAAMKAAEHALEQSNRTTNSWSKVMQDGKFKTPNQQDTSNEDDDSEQHSPKKTKQNAEAVNRGHRDTSRRTHKAEEERRNSRVVTEGKERNSGS